MAHTPLIFIVEDDDDDRLLLQMAFQEHLPTCQFAHAQNGQQALEYLSLKNQVPDLLILDLNLPMLNGLEVLQQLRANQQWQQLPVIVISDKAMALQAHLAGANDYLRKPVSFFSLVEQIQVVINQWLYKSITAKQ